MLKIHIFDSGKGIRKEDIKKLFTMFGKLHRTAEMNSEGIGLGLMICQQLVSLNGGTIIVSSDGENQGSVFTFDMKMYIDEQTQRIEKAINQENNKDDKLNGKSYEKLPLI